MFHNSTTSFGRWFFSAIPPIQFCDCTRKTHPPFYGGPVYRDFDTPPTGHASDPHASHGSVNDTTYTTQSDCSGHVCRFHSKEACGESPPLEPELLARSTSHKTDALQHTYHESFSMHDHIFSSHFYLFRISHNHYSLFSHALHNTARSLTQDSLDKHTVSSAC